MSHELGIPLGNQFYRELAVLAWKSLTESQQEELRRYLILRFIDSGTDILDGSAASRIKKRFEALLDESTFDERINEVLKTEESILSDARIHDLIKSMEHKMLDLVEMRVKTLLDARWQKWLDDEGGYRQRVDEVVARVLEGEEIDKVIFGALRRQMPKYDLRSVVAKQIDETVQHITEKYGETAQARD